VLPNSEPEPRAHARQASLMARLEMRQVRRPPFHCGRTLREQHDAEKLA